MALLTRLTLKLSCMLLASACVLPITNVKSCDQLPPKTDGDCIDPATGRFVHISYVIPPPPAVVAPRRPAALRRPVVPRAAY